MRRQTLDHLYGMSLLLIYLINNLSVERNLFIDENYPRWDKVLRYYQRAYLTEAGARPPPLCCPLSSKQIPTSKETKSVRRITLAS